MRKIFLMLSLLCCITALPRTFIVCAGITDYPGEKYDLTVSSNDAVVMERMFMKNGAATQLLIDSMATMTNICGAMTELFASATADDAVILFFSGHGTDGYFFCYDKLMPYQRIIDIMKESKAGRKMVFADMCLSGGMRKSKKYTNAKSATSVMFFLSSRSAERSYEYPSEKNSIFTRFLERGLRGGADVNRDRTITALEIFNFVCKGVKEATTDKQHPVMWGNFSNNMEIIKW